MLCHRSKRPTTLRQRHSTKSRAPNTHTQRTSPNVDIALNSLASSSMNRPSMSVVVYHIQDTIKFELGLSNNNGAGIAIDFVYDGNH